jgi:hypothetical protein
VTKRKLDGYAQQQLVIEGEKKAAELRAAREREASAAEAAARLRAAGASETAEIVEVQAAAAVAVASGPAHVAKVKSETATVSVRKHWVGRVVSMRAFCAAVAAGRVPEACVYVNLRALNEHAASLGEPLVAADPSRINELYTEDGLAIALVADTATR